MCRQIVLCQMVSSLTAPPDWEVVHFNPQDSPLEPNRWVWIRWGSCNQSPEKCHFSLMEGLTLSSRSFEWCCCLSARVQQPLAQPPVAPLLPFRDLAGMCYFVSAWTAAVWILKESGFKVLEQGRLHSGRVNISWGTSPFGQRRIWQNLRSCTRAPIMSRIKEDGVFSGQRHHVLTLSSMSLCMISAVHNSSLIL